jgi:hypothetical protein
MSDMEKKGDKKFIYPTRHLLTIPGSKVKLVTHSIADSDKPGKNKKEDPIIVLEKVK